MNAGSISPEEWQEQGSFLSTSPNEYQVFYIDSGNKLATAEKTLLLLHGFPESSFSWHKVITALQAQFDRIVVFDMIGYGFSDKPENNFSYSLIEQADITLQLCRALNIHGTHIISHDMGTSVLTELIARKEACLLPEWFNQGIQSATFTNGSLVLRFAKLRLMQKLLLGKFGKTIGRFSSYPVFAKSIKSAHSKNHTNGLSDNDIHQMWYYCQLQHGHHKNHLLIQYLIDRRRYEKSRWLPALSQADESLAIHFCWGDADQVARVEMAHYLAERVCPNARLSIMSDVGHFCQLSNPDCWTKHILDFYSKCNE